MSIKPVEISPRMDDMTFLRIIICKVGIYIFIPSYKGMDKNLADRYLKNPAFQNLPAIKENRVKPLPAAYLYTMNQHIGEAMLAIMHTVYPQLERNPHD